MNSSIVDLSQKEGPVVLSDFCILFHLRIGPSYFCQMRSYMIS
jgi:hypothetical protein